MDTSRISFGEMVAGGERDRPAHLHVPPVVRGEHRRSRLLGQRHASAWEAFGFIDILLFLVVLVTLGLVGARAMGNVPTGLPAPPGLIIAIAGAVAAVLIVFRILSHPGPDIDIEGVDFGRKIGIFLGLIAAGGITFGGYTAMNERAGSAGAAPAPGPRAGRSGPSGLGGSEVSAAGGIRTHTPFRAMAFETIESAVPPPPQVGRRS